MAVTDLRARFVADAVVTCDSDGSLYQPGVVDVDGDRITWVGPPDQAPVCESATTRLDGLLMPGFVNVHSHAPMTLFRGAAEGHTLDAFLRQVLWPREARLTADDVYWGTTLACAELLRAGVTTSCEMYIYEEAMLHALLDAGSRCVLTPGVIDVPDWDHFGSWQQRLDDVLAFLADHGGRHPRVEIGIAAHSAYALPLEALDAVARCAQERSALVHIHLAESRTETEELERSHRTTVPALLAERGFFQGRVLAAHCVWLTDDDLQLLARHDVAVAHCPQSNAKLAVGTARLADMLELGLRVGLGTDSAASNNRLDLWQEMRLAPLMASAQTGRPAVLTNAEAIALATRGGAEALGHREIGALEAGRFADMILVRMDAPAFVPVLEPHDVLSHLLWSASSSLISDVWVGGDRVVREGTCRRLDENRARREVQQRALRLGTA
jgi:5-methylthioadenosine/S-adenosylhomocysteine deaminase